MLIDGSPRQDTIVGCFMSTGRGSLHSLDSLFLLTHPSMFQWLLQSRLWLDVGSRFGRACCTVFDSNGEGGRKNDKINNIVSSVIRPLYINAFQVSTITPRYVEDCQIFVILRLQPPVQETLAVQHTPYRRRDKKTLVFISYGESKGAR